MVKTCPASFLSMVGKVFEKVMNNGLVDHLRKYGLFSDLQCGFRSSQSTADLLKVASGRFGRAFNNSGTTQFTALDVSKTFDRVWHVGFL